ncbi:N-acetyl-alpha-D-glucosaminyl L-malate synthase [Lachnospiraceae bacterium]|nr:N-acetyl-alpha-D-glucosaminyl L-malate synthase [Lachnospiraceae bacterium]
MKLLLFGTGDYYNRYKKWFVHQEILALLDNSKQKQYTRIDEIRVLPPEEGVKLPYDVVVILSFYAKAMKQQLINLKVAQNNIYHFFDLRRLFAQELTEIIRLYPRQYFPSIQDGIEDMKISSKILLMSQDLTLGGPAIALFHTAIILRKNGYNVVFASMIDGPLREKLTESGIPVVVDVCLQIAVMREIDWVNTFSFIVCNTMNFHVFLSERDTKIPILWWLHDAAFFYEGVNKEIITKICLENLNVVSVGPIPQMAINKFFPDLLCGELLYGVTNITDNKAPMDSKSIVQFITIGFLEEIKGQDILLAAIKRLSDSVRKQCRFYIVGHKETLFGEQLQKDSEDIEEIVFTGSVDRRTIHELLDTSNVLICPSKQDSMPTVTAEAMMHAVPCIVSDVIGTAAYIHDGVDGFIFQNEIETALAEKIQWCVENKSVLKEIGKKARDIYEQFFSMEVFERKLLKLVESIVAKE